MAVETDLMKLYSGHILRLASEIPHHERLTAPMATVKRRSPLCGSSIIVDLSVKDGRISDFGQEVKACALGQAAAAVTGSGVIGLSLEELEAGRDALRALLTDQGPTPAPPFQDFEFLRPARDYKNRHASILLSMEATCDAMTQALQTDWA